MSEALMSDRMVTVCVSCRCASCWQGEFYCEDFRSVGTVDVPARVLDQEHNEHPDWYSEGRLAASLGEKGDGHE